MKLLKIAFLTTACVGYLYPECDSNVCHSATPGGRYTHPSFTNESIIPRTITTDELELKIKQSPQVIVINVLGKMLYDDCCIAGSVNCPLRFLEEQAKSWDDKNQEIVIYCACAECDASLKACRLLTTMGFTNLWEYEKGIREWCQLKKATTGPCKEAYLSDKSCK
ncbi:MAG: rhodanese-like domain-containing protein [Candidatus Babeliales bacterium]|nr:rhodanese-like domain-containing protein [Candidatus Babeliales bacterium]